MSAAVKRRASTRSKRKPAVTRARSTAPPLAPVLSPPAPAAALGVNALLEAVFGAEPVGWLIAADCAGYAAIEEIFRWRRGAWRQLGPFRVDQEPTVEDFARRGGPVGFCPILRGQPDYSGTLLAATVLWAVVRIPLAARAPGEILPRRDAGAVAAIRGRLAALPVAPNVVVDQGDELAALWRVREPIADSVRVQAVLLRLAGALGATPQPNPWLVDRRPALDPRAARILLPGATSDKVWPPVTVGAEIWTPDPVDVTALEEAILGPHRA